MLVLAEQMSLERTAKKLQRENQNVAYVNIELAQEQPHSGFAARIRCFDNLNTRFVVAPVLADIDTQSAVVAAREIDCSTSSWALAADCNAEPAADCTAAQVIDCTAAQVADCTAAQAFDRIAMVASDCSKTEAKGMVLVVAKEKVLRSTD